MSLKEWYKKGLRILKWPALAVFLFHMGTQVCHTARALYYTAYPSQIRSSFATEFGFPLCGYEIEETTNVARIAAALQKERLEKDFSLYSLYLRSEHYYQLPLDEQFFYLVGSGNNGFHYNKRITLQTPVWRNTVHHEVKHEKAAQLPEEFYEKWHALAKDEQGKSLYLPTAEDYCYDYWFLRSFVRKQNTKDDEKVGFVSSYARRNIHEDIAELCEEAEVGASQFIPWLYTQPNFRIQAKVRLAEQYQLIPAKFSEYVYVLSQQDQKFMDASEIFLKAHQKSIYECVLRWKRGKFLEEKAEQVQIKEYTEQALTEYKKGLQAMYKDPDIYPVLLEDSAFCAAKGSNEKTATLYRKALEEYQKRYENNDLSLTIIGVTDVLRALGEKL